ncbi:MYND-type domain-containing protein [Mycena indigotica]|uniref:MYND-type domain-containing protein n=1 Tax=Mycena indigotica TaxID=2126181 RepID=A0A8H6WBJ3_9AGAR|nr:MYND-type domain-containing protein [Mycena indigotica]KAF7310306.1 MYND-type domain-containing protein [Mycena indigotica]
MQELPEDLWPPYKTWPKLAFPRNITSLDTPWVASPAPNQPATIQLPELLKEQSATIKQPERARGWARLKRLVRRRSGGANGTEALPREFPKLTSTPANVTPGPQLFLRSADIGEPPTAADWRAFAAYSRPSVNGVDVHNTFTDSPTPYRELDPEEVDVQEVFDSLRSPRGGVYPERWVRGIKHPALPPKPTWHVPLHGEPLPFPWELHLNPFLHAAVTGPAPIFWNIRQGADASVLYGGPDDAAFPLSAQDLAQPATFPLVTHMYVSGLGLAAARLPWKFFVINMSGIRIRDIFNAITANFLELVFPREVQKWSRQTQAHARLEFRLRGGHLKNDGLRRMDYLSGQLFFRGLAPNPDLTGWMLFVGPQW